MSDTDTVDMARARSGRSWVDDPTVRRVASGLAGTLWFLFVIHRFFPAPAGVIFQGMVIGATTSFIAFGVALIYRSNRIINFAQADLGGLPSAFGVLLILASGLPFLVAFPAAIVAAIVLGSVLEATILRRFAEAPRLILTVVTLGLSQLLAAATQVVPNLFDLQQTILIYDPPIDVSFSIGRTVIQGNEVLALAFVPVVVIGLNYLLRGTSIGIAIRASAERADRAALLGVPVNRVQNVVWIVASVLATVGVFLRAGIIGLPLSALGPTILVRTLAAAVIGRMEKLPTIFVASVALGVLESCVIFSDENATAFKVDALLFVVVLGALLLQRRGKTARGDEASAWAASNDTRPIPAELRRLPELRIGIPTAGLALLGVVLALPLFLSEADVSLASSIAIICMVCVSLVVLSGWAGQVSLGQIGFLGAGAAVGGWLTTVWQWDLAAVLVASGLVGAAVAMVIGIPALRIRGLFLAVATLSFALAMSSYGLNANFVSWLPSGRIPRTPIFGRISVASETRYFYLVISCLLLSMLIARGVRNSRTGRVLIGVRENERGAQAYGINVISAKLQAFAISGFIASFAGALFVHNQQALGIQPFLPSRSIQVFIIIVIGGLGSLPGAIIGPVLFEGLNYFRTSFPDTIADILFFVTTGIGVIVILLIFPGGLGELYYRIRDRGLLALADRHDIHVPSLVADSLQDDQRPEAPPDAVPVATSDDEDVLLRVRDLDVAYGTVQVLFGVDFDVKQGDVIALLGTNGAGKSTLLKAISGLQAPRRGTIEFGGKDLAGSTPQQIAAEGIIQMPGGKGVFPGLTVEENLRIAGWLFQDDKDHVESSIAEMKRTFPVIEERWNQPAGNLSGGEQQMVTLAQAFIMKPKILMIDELSLGLAPVIVEQLLEIIEVLRAQGMTLILVEQSVNVALTVAETAYFMEKGEIRFKGPTAELLDRPDVLRSVFLEGAGAGDGERREVDDDGQDSVVIPELTITARDDGGARLPRDPATPMLEVRNLVKTFGGIRATNDVSFTLGHGEILGFIGPNGAGKTTLFDQISGFLESDSGRILIGGIDVTAAGPDARARLGLGRSFQDARLFPALTVTDTIKIALERQLEVRDPVSAAFQVPVLQETERVVQEKVDELIELMNLSAFAAKFVGELSTGSRRIVDLACILAHEPDVILFDEPSSGIAQSETEALGPLLQRIRAATNAALLVIEHDMQMICSISDRLVALELGAVVVDGPPDDVINHPAVVESYLGTNEATISRSGRS